MIVDVCTGRGQLVEGGLVFVNANDSNIVTYFLDTALKTSYI